MTTKERANFLVEKYGEKSIQVVDEVLSNMNESDVIKYWNDVKSTCKQLIKERSTIDINQSS
jgi:hypothetical protein